MANQDDDQNEENPVQDTGVGPLVPSGTAPLGDGVDAPLEAVPGQLGVTRYVHGAFLAVGVCLSYIVGKVLETVWSTLASWPAATQQFSWLLRYREDERPTFTMTAGFVLGLVVGFWMFRQVAVKRWADDVASELAKVHWPNRELVKNGTVVVVVAGLFATVYVGLLDRLWVFVTALVYGA